MSPRKRRQLNVNKRKIPIQGRAVSTIDTLLNATAQILTKEGYDHLSTNRIAEVAGFSIGSLYQYFSSKESIVASLIDRQLSADFEMLKGVLEASEGLLFEESARKMIRTLIEIFGKNRKLRKVIYEQVPRLSKMQKRQAIETEIRKLILKNLGNRFGNAFSKFDLEQAELSVYVIVRAVMGAITSAMLEDAPFMAEPRFEDELVGLVIGFAQFKLASALELP